MKNPNRQAAIRRSEAHGGNDTDTIVVYNSSNGSSMQYAELIAKALDADIIPYSKKTLGYVTLYKNVVFGGWIRAREITRLNMLKQNAGQFGLAGKNIFIFGVGLGPDTEEYKRLICKRNGIERDTFFYLEGRYNPGKIKRVDAASLAAMKNTIYGEMKEGDAQVLRERIENGYDGVDPLKIIPLVEAVMKAKEIR